MLPSEDQNMAAEDRLADALARMVKLTGIAAQGNDYLNLAAALRHARDVLRETGYDWLLKSKEETP